jgi:hypothetical protein
MRSGDDRADEHGADFPRNDEIRSNDLSAGDKHWQAV